MTFLTTLGNVALIVLGFGLLIFVHELGHFLAAKWAGIRTEAFAIGMGPVVCSWRKGIGFRVGSTAGEYERRVRERMASQGQEPPKDLQVEKIYRVGDEIGLGETEYSLRWLPIGGFVKMLGQEDANPEYVSDDPRSYNRCPIGKRMIVVSAGVIMNLLLAVIVFVIAFMIGVKFEAPVVGDTDPNLAAATTMASNAAALSVTTPGLQPGDRVLTIDGDPAKTFADIQIASAMSRPGTPVKLTIEREGIAETLQFSLLPQKSAQTGLLSVGIDLAASTRLRSRDDSGGLELLLRESGVTASGVRPGMKLLRVNGQEVSNFQHLQQIVDASGGKTLTSEWTAMNRQDQPVGTLVNAPLLVEPNFQTLRDPDAPADAVMNFNTGLFGLAPLVQIHEVLEGSSNEGTLLPGDVVLSVAGIQSPRYSEFLTLIQNQTPGEIAMTVLRDGKAEHIKAVVQRRGLFKSAGVLNIRLGLAWGLPIIARPVDQVAVVETIESSGGKAIQELKTVDTPAAALRLIGGARIDAVGGTPVTDWPGIREQLRVHTQGALNAHEGATVSLLITNPTPGKEQEIGQLQLSAADVEKLHALGWHTDLPPDIFEPIYTVRTADGNPLKAVVMGFEETHKLVMMTYLTIDRLFRGSVGVDQLRGPVGIVHIGAKVADKGLLYSLFFLGMISVNLAVINFLPLPIVDGGLFLFLIYEKIKGKPPSIAFQNAATIVGLCIIVTLFMVTFYNDVVRLFS